MKNMKAFQVKANFVRTRIVKGKSYNPNTDIFLNFPQTWQFPLNSHDFGQVCGLIINMSFEVESNMKWYIVYE